jgi:hypothetical protein
MIPNDVNRGGSQVRTKGPRVFAPEFSQRVGALLYQFDIDVLAQILNRLIQFFVIVQVTISPERTINVKGDNLVKSSFKFLPNFSPFRGSLGKRLDQFLVGEFLKKGGEQEK